MTRGTIEERAGRFRAKVSIAGCLVRCGTHGSREEAQRAIDVACAVAAGLAPGPVETLGALALSWLTRRELAGKRGVAQERSVVRSHLLGTPLAETPVDEITPRAFRAWVASLASKHARRARRGHPTVTLGRPVSRQTVRHAVRVVRGILARAVLDELIPSSPADVDVKHELPSAATDTEAWTFLTAEEIATLLGSPHVDARDRLLYTIAIFTGLRAGELWGLRWGDVVLDGPRPRLDVRRSRSTPTKGGKPREVPLFAPALAALLALRPEDPGAAELVFPSATGGIRRHGDDNGWRDRPQRYKGRVVVHPGDKSRAGIARPVRFHDLRHTCASHLVSGTWGRAWSLVEVAAFLGHTSTEVTKRYAHLSPDALYGAARGTATAVPATAPDLRIVRRAMGDSNARPTAPEAMRDASDRAALGADGTAVGLARDILGRVARGEAVARPIAVLVELAGAVLEATAARDAAKKEGGTG